MPKVILLKNGSRRAADRERTLTELSLQDAIRMLRINKADWHEILPQSDGDEKLMGFCGYKTVWVLTDEEEDGSGFRKGAYASPITPAQARAMFPYEARKMDLEQFGTGFA